MTLTFVKNSRTKSTNNNKVFKLTWSFNKLFSGRSYLFFIFKTFLYMKSQILEQKLRYAKLFGIISGSTLRI